MAHTAIFLSQPLLRRAAYRLAGEAFALMVLEITILEIYVKSFVCSNGVSEIGAVVWKPSYRLQPEAVGWAHIIGEWAACASGYWKESDGHFVRPDLSCIEPEIHDKILGFASRSAYPITNLAEALFHSKKLSGEHCLRIVTEAWREEQVRVLDSGIRFLSVSISSRHKTLKIRQFRRF